jgi:hypothetical protein
MGKLLIKLGERLQAFERKFKCQYNRLVCLLLVSVDDDCPYQIKK